MIRVLAWVCVGSLIVTVNSAEAAVPSQAQEQQVRLEGRPLALAVGAVRVSEKLEGQVDRYYANKGFQWVKLLVAVQNLATSTLHTNPHDFTLSTPEGLTVNLSIHMYDLAGGFYDAVDLPPGGKSAGWLIFLIVKRPEYVLNMHALSNTVRKRIIASNWTMKGLQTNGEP